MFGQFGVLFGIIIVLIKLLDINDNNLIFKESFYCFIIFEFVFIGILIGKIMVYDDDIGENVEMEYSIEDDDLKIFDIIIDNDI